MKSIWALLVVCVVLGSVSGMAFAAAPVIVGANIDRTVRSNAPGSILYDEVIVLTVSDADYTSDIAYVTLTDSASPPNTVTFSVSDATSTTNTTATFTWTKRDLLLAPRAAPYTFQVFDREHNSDTFTTGTPPPLPALHLSVVLPAMDSVVSSVQPTLQWQNPSAATEKTTYLYVYEEGQQSWVWNKNTTDGSVSAVYGVGGISYAGRTQLLANHSYVWTVRSGTNAAVYSMTGTSHKLTVKDWQEAHGRFTEYGAWSISPPALGGKLAYGIESVATLVTGGWGVTGILAYGSDPSMRTWLGPEYGNDPDWSPDGQKLLYATPAGLSVHDFGSGLTTLIPGTSGADAKCRWTPDGSGIIFGRDQSGDSYGLARAYALWLMNADGSNAHAIGSILSWELTASPSPDGAWIAYDSTDGYLPSTVHVVAYDGSNDQVLAATGVVGQNPGYHVTSLAQPAWSPDGAKLAVVFQAEGAGLLTLIGIGTVPVAGGPVTPLFLSPYSDCCAKPQAPAWSPDGTQVVFTSGHHQPGISGYDTNWAAELWLVSADGSLAAPVQLTEDYSLDRHVSWWRANTPAGSNVVFRRGEVTLTFATVSADGTSDVVALSELPGPAPAGLALLPKSYQASTTAQYSGGITVAISYQPGDIPPGRLESSLLLLHWEDGQWVNITSALDTTAHVITGQCTSLGDFALAVVVPPSAEFTAAPTSGLAPLSVQFSDGSANAPTLWAWSFGDGATSSEQNPSHAYTAVGSYDVTLTASNAGGSGEITKSGYITVTLPAPVAGFSGTPVRGLTPLTVSFQDASTGVVTTRAWTFGDGGTSNQQNPSHTYTAAGSYDVSLTVSNAGGSNTMMQAGYITALAPPPVAGFSAAPVRGPVPLAVSFTDTSTGHPTGWQWSFGDGGASAEQNPSHTYAAVGVYTVALTASNAGGADTCTKANLITVLPLPPVASFTAAPTSGVAPLTVTFTDASTGSPTSWLWTFGDGGASSQQNPTHAYASAGTYSVTLTATNAGGSNTLTQSDLIKVLPPAPVAAFSANPTRGAVPLAVAFTDASSGVVTGWAWTFGDGATAGEPNPSHTYASPGLYSVSLTASNAGGSNTCTKTDFITALPPAPVADFSFTPATGVAPLTVVFSDASSGVVTSWSWNFGDGGTAAVPNAAHTYAVAGSYTVSLTASNAGGASTCTKPNAVTVLPPPPVADFSGFPTGGPVPLAVSFADLSSGVVTSWLWDFGDGGISGEQNPTYTYGSAGTYAVSLTAANASGANTCTKLAYITVTAPAPVASFIAAPVEGVLPLVVQFVDTSTGGPTAWLWDFGDGASSVAQSPSHSYEVAGVYSVSLTASNAGGADTCTQLGLVTVLAPPSPGSFSVAPTSGCAPLTVSFSAAAVGAGTSWLWSFGDGATSTLRNPSHVYTGVGSYTVTLTVKSPTGFSTTTVPNCVVTYQFVGPHSPLSSDGTASFGNRPYVPVRFQLLDASGHFVSTAEAKLFVALHAADGTVGNFTPAVSTDYAGNAFVYDAKTAAYSFSLDTRNMSGGTWSLRVTVNGSLASEIILALNKKPIVNAPIKHVQPEPRGKKVAPPPLRRPGVRLGWR